MPLHSFTLLSSLDTTSTFPFLLSIQALGQEIPNQNLTFSLAHCSIQTSIHAHLHSSPHMHTNLLRMDTPACSHARRIHSPPHKHARSLGMDMPTHLLVCMPTCQMYALTTLHAHFLGTVHLTREGVREISIGIGAGAGVGTLRIEGALNVAGPEQMFYSGNSVSCCPCSLQESNRIN